MNVCSQQLLQCVVNEPVALQAAQTAKRLRYDSDIEMAATVPRSFVTGMQMTLILDQEFNRIEILA